MSYEPEKKIELEHFRAISLAISKYEDVNLLGRHLVESICRTFGIKASSVLLFDDREDRLFYLCSHGLSHDYLRWPPVYSSEFIEFAKGEVAFFPDLKNDARVGDREVVETEGIVSMLSFPIKFKENTIGLLKLYNSESWMLHPEDVESVSILAAQFGLVIENNGLKNFLGDVQSILCNLPMRMIKGFAPCQLR